MSFQQLMDTINIPKRMADKKNRKEEEITITVKDYVYYDKHGEVIPEKVKAITPYPPPKERANLRFAVIEISAIATA